MQERLYYILVVEKLNALDMSRLEEIVFGKTFTRIFIAFTVLWAVCAVILAVKNILTLLN